MPNKIFLTPKPGMTIPNPDDGQPITDGGMYVPNSRFYRNYVKRGEAVISKPPKPAKSTDK